jgi:hypothetical protein
MIFPKSFRFLGSQIFVGSLYQNEAGTHRTYGLYHLIESGTTPVGSFVVVQCWKNIPKLRALMYTAPPLPPSNLSRIHSYDLSYLSYE